MPSELALMNTMMVAVVNFCVCWWKAQTYLCLSSSAGSVGTYLASAELQLKQRLLFLAGKWFSYCIVL